jgi:hypothetical protein
MNKREKIVLLENALDKLNEGLDLVKQVVRDMPDRRSYEAYLIGHLENSIDGVNPHDQNVAKLLEVVRCSPDEDIEDAECDQP